MDFSNDYLMTLPCFLCEKPFTHMDELQKHLHLHTIQPILPVKTETFTCNICGRNLRSQSSLDGHYKHYHEACVKTEKYNEIPEIYECPSCDNVFIQKKNLIDHQQREHCAKGEKKPKIYNFPSFHIRAAKRTYPLRSPYFNPNLWMKNEMDT